jgi:hypothetical protein
LRYSTVDLDGGSIQGGREHDWTLGVNWYFGQHLKLQANYIRAFSDRKQLAVDPHIVEFRAQVTFSYEPQRGCHHAGGSLFVGVCPAVFGQGCGHLVSKKD